MKVGATVTRKTKIFAFNGVEMRGKLKIIEKLINLTIRL
jgi:hypothetical protein